jgi:dUTP pyrophosphatase
MNTLTVKIKRLNPNAVKPFYSKHGDAGLDLVAVDLVETAKHVTYYTGLAFEIPENNVGLLFARSSIRNYDLSLSNSVGVIDSGYRGEIQVTFNKTDSYNPIIYKIGDKVAQLVILPYTTISLVETGELSSSERGTGGFGSTGL